MRRTGKVGGDNQPKTGSEQSAQTAGENLQGQLQEMSQQMGTAIADNVTAQALMIGFTTVRSLIFEGREELMPDWVKKNLI